LRSYERIPGQEKIVNNSGDLQHPLDFAFDRILNYTIRQKAHAIISEEMAPIVYGVGEQDLNTYRLVVFTDPVDGSLQIEDAGAFGSIIGIGFLKPGETLANGDFDPRTRFLFGFDLGYATGTSLGMFNLANALGQPEVVLFGLTKDETSGQLEFRKQATFDNLMDVEINLDWEANSLIPAVNTANPIESALHLALGGSLADSAPEYRVFMEQLMERYGYVPQYTGALQIDEKRLSTISKLRKASGVGYFYPTQYKVDKQTGQLKGSQKLRLFFEGYYYAALRKAMGAEVLNGDTVLPLLNDRAQGEQPSGTKASIMSASSWITKLYMAWVEHLKANNFQTRAEIEILKSEWRNFLDDYILDTQILIREVTSFTQENDGQDNIVARSAEDVRRALLTWDSIDKGENYFPRLLELSPQEMYQKLFIQAPQSDAAMLDEEDLIKSLVSNIGEAAEYLELWTRPQEHMPNSIDPELDKQMAENWFNIYDGQFRDTINDLRARGDANLVRRILTELKADQVIDHQVIMERYGKSGAEIFKEYVGLLRELSKTLESSDAAQLGQDVGGIDFNRINVNREGAGFDIQFSPQSIEPFLQDGFEGFVPVIINIIPLPTVLPLLGLEPRTRQREEEF